VLISTCGSTVVQQFYQSRVSDEFVLRGNTAIVRCLIPSFVADFVQVVEWITDGGSFAASSASNTDYGNTKCYRLSFPYPPHSKRVFPLQNFRNRSDFPGCWMQTSARRFPI
jgi:hypothetical protein